MKKWWLLTALAFLGLHTGVRADDWPQWMGPNRDGVWAETGVVEKLPPTLTVKWRKPIAYGYAGPAVAAGKVYVPSFEGEGDFTPNAGSRNKIAGKEVLTCFNASTGEPKWKFEYPCNYDVSYPAGPRATPAVAGGKVYFLGTMGHLSCLDAETGSKVFQIDLKERFGAETPIWGFASHPLVDAGKVYLMAGGPGSGAVALNANSGETIWKALDVKEPGYAPPSMFQAGGRKQLVVATPQSIDGLDPENGKPFWSVPFTPAYGMSVCAPQRDGDVLYTAGEGDQAVALRLAADKPAAEELWRGKVDTAVYPICGTPVAYQGHVYGVCTKGELRCVDLKTGDRRWSDLKAIVGGRPKPSGSAFIVRNGDRFFIFSETGDLILAKMTPEKYEEIGRAKLIEPTGTTWGRNVVWSHPAFANKCVFARNDKEIVCASLAAE